MAKGLTIQYYEATVIIPVGGHHHAMLLAQNAAKGLDGLGGAQMSHLGVVWYVTAHEVKDGELRLEIRTVDDVEVP